MSVVVKAENVSIRYITGDFKDIGLIYSNIGLKS